MKLQSFKIIIFLLFVLLQIINANSQNTLISYNSFYNDKYWDILRKSQFNSWDILRKQQLTMDKYWDILRNSQINAMKTVHWASKQSIDLNFRQMEILRKNQMKTNMTGLWATKQVMDNSFSQMDILEKRQMSLINTNNWALNQSFENMERIHKNQLLFYKMGIENALFLPKIHASLLLKTLYNEINPSISKFTTFKAFSIFEGAITIEKPEISTYYSVRYSMGYKGGYSYFIFQKDYSKTTFSFTPVINIKSSLFSDFSRSFQFPRQRFNIIYP